MDKVEMIAQLADVKDCLYRTTLGLTSLIELLVEQGLCTREDLIQKAHALEHELFLDPITDLG